jgi:hypothetical protein
MTFAKCPEHFQIPPAYLVIEDASFDMDSRLIFNGAIGGTARGNGP